MNLNVMLQNQPGMHWCTPGAWYLFSSHLHVCDFLSLAPPAPAFAHVAHFYGNWCSNFGLQLLVQCFCGKEGRYGTAIKKGGRMGKEKISANSLFPFCFFFVLIFSLLSFFFQSRVRDSLRQSVWPALRIPFVLLYILHFKYVSAAVPRNLPLPTLITTPAYPFFINPVFRFVDLSATQRVPLSLPSQHCALAFPRWVRQTTTT